LIVQLNFSDLYPAKIIDFQQNRSFQVQINIINISSPAHNGGTEIKFRNRNKC